ncbi:MAG: PKD domain-containing protein [Flavobacteriales bacterium]|nr:PKD domain-containing protein [Flavobacteriales bacterium]
MRRSRINAYGSIDGAISIPLRVNVGVTGTYVISGVEVEGLELNCLSIEDLETGIVASLENGATYSFTMDAAADPDVPRFVLHANNGPQSSFTADNTTVVVGQPVQFTATSTTGNHAWSFGDGAQSTEQDPAHAYTMAGTYTVVHTVDDGLCSMSTSVEITVELSTGVATSATTTTHVWPTATGSWWTTTTKV